MKVKRGILFSLCTLLLSVSLFAFFNFISITVHAASVTFENGQTQLEGFDPEYTVTASLSINASPGAEYYLRGVFYKQGSTNYCGYTWNNTGWFNGPYTTNGGWKNFLKVTINDNGWKDEVKARLDTQDTACQESGLYGFKIQRFTANSSSGTFDDQTEQLISVIIPTPTPTPSPTPTPTPTPTNTPTPTRTPTPTKALSLAVLDEEDVILPIVTFKKKDVKFKPSEYPEAVLSTKSAEQNDEKKSISKNTLIKDAKDTFQENKITSISVIIGAILLMSCGILIFRNQRKSASF